MTQQVVSANRLTDGLVVYLTTGAGWSERLADGHIVADDAAAECLLAAARRSVDDRIVVDPYLIEVGDSDSGLRPTKYREYIRAVGPTVRPDIGKQAEL